MKKFMSKTKYFLIATLLVCLSICFVPTFNVYADETKLTLNDLLTKEEYQKQNITNKLPFNPNFEGSSLSERENGWQTAGELTTGNATITGDMTSTEEITTTGEEDSEGNKNLEKVNQSGVKFSEIGASEGKYAMLLLNLKKGVSAFESIENIQIPARALYLLTIDVQVKKISNANGVYIQLIEGENAFKGADDESLLKYTISKIKSTEKSEDGKTSTIYVTYALLIQGNELIDTNAKLQISLGYRTTNSEGSTTTNEEVGVAAIDNIQLFTLSTAQASDLTGAKNVTSAKFSSITTSTDLKVNNGSFNVALQQDYNYDGKTLLAPAGWTQKTSLNNTQAQFGIINTNPTMFNNNNLSSQSLVLNPGLSTYQSGDPANKYNNVLMLYNETQTHQAVFNSFSINKESIYEITFEFCTPALYDNFADENNSISFYVKSGDTIIYKRENVYSYNENEHTKDLTKWSRFSLIVETTDAKQNLSFQIVFGTEESPKKGCAFVDNVLALSRTEETAFSNIYENTILLNTEELKYLETGYVSLEDVKNLKENNYVATYKFETTQTSGTTTEEEETTQQGFNLTTLWFVIPSALLAICTIVGLIVYYLRKIKNNPKVKKLSRKKVTNVSYKRKKSTTVKVEEKKIVETKVEETVNNSNLNILEQIQQLEEKFENKQITLKKYLKQREKLESQLTEKK